MMNDNSRTWFHIYSTLWSIIAQCLLCLFNTPFHHSLTIVLVPSYNIEWIAFMPTQFLRILFFSLYLHRFHSQNIKSTAQIAFDSLSLSSHNTFTFLHHPIPLLPTTHYWQLANTLLSQFVCYSLVALISFLQYHFCNTQLIIHPKSRNLLLSVILDSFWIPKTLPISTILIIIISLLLLLLAMSSNSVYFIPLLLLLSIVLLSLLSSSMLFGLPIMQSVIHST